MRHIIAVICHIKCCMPANMSLASLVIITTLSGQGDLATTQHKRDAEINLDVVFNFSLFVFFGARDVNGESITSSQCLVRADTKFR